MLRQRCAAIGLLGALAAATCGEAILIPTQNGTAGSAGRALRIHASKLRRATDCSLLLPELATFREKWEQKMTEPHDSFWQAPMKIRPHVIVGVFSVGGCQDRPFRDVVRSTWMTQNRVCVLGNHTGPDDNCALYVTFVVGQDGQGGEEAEVDDMTVLPLPENLNCGKTPAWFQYASTKYPWSTHVMKMDMDAFPYVPGLLATIRTWPGWCPNIIGGRSWTSPEVEPNETLRGDPLLANFLWCSHGRPAGCWSYMQGGLYFLSTELARNASAPGGWWQEESKKCGPEDAIAGRAVYLHGVTKGVCVDAIRLSLKRDLWHEP